MKKYLDFKSLKQIIHNDLTGFVRQKSRWIDQKEWEIRAFVQGTYFSDKFIELAQQQQEAFPDASSRPPLFGIPVGIKDIFRLKGLPTQCGSELPYKLFDGDEASSVQKLRQAGCLFPGKTVTTEFACFEPGPTRNPHCLNHTPGGSSSGSAAGVAADYFPVSLGTQTAGSITRPAAYCGVIGFKPSYGRIPMNGVIPFSPSADHIGVFCQDFTYLEPFLGTLVDDWNPVAGSTSSKSSSSMPVLGVPVGPYLKIASERGLTAFNKAIKKLKKLGFTVKEVPALDKIVEINEWHSSMIARELADVHLTWFGKNRNSYKFKTRETIENGMKLPLHRLEEIRNKQIEVRDEIESLMDSAGIDYWVCPSTIETAPEGLSSTGSPIMNLCWTFTGLPTLAVPFGHDEKNLPFGLQFVGRFGEDEKFLSNLVMHLSRSATPRPPVIW